MDLIKTIEDDEQIEYDDSGSDDGEEISAPKKKKSKTGAAVGESTEFFSEFNFVNDAKEYMKDTW